MLLRLLDLLDDLRVLRPLLVKQRENLDAPLVEARLVELQRGQTALKGVQSVLELPHIIVLIFCEGSNILLFIGNFDKFITQVVNLRLHVISLDLSILFKGETHSYLTCQ